MSLRPRDALFVSLFALAVASLAREPTARADELPASVPAGVTAAPAPVVTVRVVLESTGAPLELQRVRDNPRASAGAAEYLREPLCRTPCALSLPPGELEVLTGGPGLREALFTVRVPATGVRARIHAGRRAPFTVGFGLLVASVAFVIAGPVLIAVAPPTPAAGDQRAFFEAGGVVLGIGGVAAVTSLVLMLTNPVGVASVEAPTSAR